MEERGGATLGVEMMDRRSNRAVRSGLPYHRVELKVPAKAVELKLLVASPASGKIGTLTIPLSDIEGSVAIAK